jgi:hypothetical protein
MIFSEMFLKYVGNAEVLEPQQGTVQRASEREGSNDPKDGISAVQKVGAFIADPVRLPAKALL